MVANVFTGSVPENYDAGLGPVVFEPYAREMVGRVRLEAGARVLELAAGTGRVTRLLTQALPQDGRLVATDLSPLMLERAQQAVFDPRVTWEQADATQLPFPAESFDVVVCQFGAMFYPDREKGHREAYRVLAPGGMYHFSTWGTQAQNPWAEIVQNIVEDEMSEDPPGFLRVPYSYHAAAEMAAVLGSAGFTEIETVWVDLEGVGADAATFAKGAVQGTPLGNEIRSRAGDLDTIQARVEKAFSEAFGSGPLRTPMRALMVQARKPQA